MPKQNVTISITRGTLRKAKSFAARRETSISALLAEQIETLVAEEEAFGTLIRQASTLLDQGFHLGGAVRTTREALHER